MTLSFAIVSGAVGVSVYWFSNESNNNENNKKLHHKILNPEKVKEDLEKEQKVIYEKVEVKNKEFYPLYSISDQIVDEDVDVYVIKNFKN